MRDQQSPRRRKWGPLNRRKNDGPPPEHGNRTFAARLGLARGRFAAQLSNFEVMMHQRVSRLFQSWRPQSWRPQSWRPQSWRHRSDSSAMVVRGIFVLIFQLVAIETRANVNVISDQLVDGAGQPLVGAGGSHATLSDLGLGTPPPGQAGPVKLVPWSTLPNDIAQFTFVDDRFFAATVTGQVYEFSTTGQRSQEPLVDIASLRAEFSMLGPASGRGLRGIAFHPDFGSNGLLYTMHRELGAAQSATHGDLTAQAHYVLGEWDFNNAIDGAPTFRSVLRVGYPATDYAGGQIGFKPSRRSRAPRLRFALRRIWRRGRGMFGKQYLH